VKKRFIQFIYVQKTLGYSRKVILSILVVSVLVGVPLAYAAVADFLTSINGSNGGATFINPQGLAVDSNDRIIVGEVDNGNQNVQIFDSTGAFVVALTGGAGFSQPSSIAVNSTNFIIVGDTGGTDKVEIYDSTGAFVRALTGSTLTDVGGVAVNSTGHIFVADRGDDLIEIYDKGGFFLKNLSGTQLGGTNFGFVESIAVDSNDRLLVIDDAADPTTVQIFDGNEQFVTSFTGVGIGAGGGILWDTTTAVAVDASNRIYVTETNLTPETILLPKQYKSMIPQEHF